MGQRIVETDNKVYSGSVELESLQTFFEALSGPDLYGVRLPSLKLLDVRAFTPTYEVREEVIDGSLHQWHKHGAEIREDFEKGIFAIRSLEDIIEARRQLQETHKSRFITERKLLETSTSSVEKMWLIALGKLVINGPDIYEPNVRFLVEPHKSKGYYFTTRKRQYDHRNP
jgi:hypothetical protein